MLRLVPISLNKKQVLQIERFWMQFTYHTTGRTGMTLLEKIVYLADYIEPGRSFPGVDEVREMAKKSLDAAMIKAVRNTIVFLMNKKQAIYPDTFYTYNDLIVKFEGEDVMTESENF